ncbi:hypothetical protein SAMN05421854_10258 [Amycolatopsis rubida]|uniref:Uncharacterized protein n=2 Tax=Amycolatopsis rubida TaxID=112413 RepID=A0A1I5HSY2_9PSEU|nr:hypothetical protein SAMN05421854_10258 [Amycolatopsis rubida]
MVNGLESGVVLLGLNANRTLPASMNALHGIDGDYLFGEATLDFPVWRWPGHRLVTDIKLGDQSLHRAVENGELALDTRPGLHSGREDPAARRCRAKPAVRVRLPFQPLNPGRQGTTRPLTRPRPD